MLVLAQTRVDGGAHSVRSVVPFAIAALAWTLALRLVPPRLDAPTSVAPTGITWSDRRTAAIVLATGAGLLTWHSSAGGVYTRWNLLAWPLTVVLWLYALSPHTFTRSQPLGVRTRRALWIAVTLVAVVAVGAFFRYHDLSGVPREPSSDHAEKILDVEEVLGGTHPIFFPRNTGREPLQFYVTAGLVRLGAGATFGTLKAETAFVGLLAVVGVLLLAWELGGVSAGLLAAALVAVSQWPVSLARDGLRHTFAITAAAFALWLLSRYLRTRGRWELLACGAVLGIGLHGYTAFRIVPPFVVAVVAVSWLRRPRTMLGETAILVGTVAVAVLPLARYAFDHPDLVWYRTLRRVGSEEAPVGGFTHAVDTLVTNAWNAALAFTWRGESSNVALVVFDPFLDVVTAAAFLAGLVVLVAWLRAGADERLWMLVAGLPVLCLASVLNLSFPGENPSAPRMGPVAPLVFAVASFSLAYVVQLGGAVRARAGRLAIAFALVAALAVATADNYVSFFRDFDRQYRAFVPNTSEAVAALRRTGVPRERLFFVPAPNWIDARNVGAELGGIEWGFSNVVEPDDRLPAYRGRELAFVLNVDDAAGRLRLISAYPNGSSRRVHSDVDKDFVLFLVRGRAGS